MHAAHVAVRAVEPGEHEYLLVDREVLQGVTHRRFEDEPSVRRALVSLFRGERRID